VASAQSRLAPCTTLTPKPYSTLHYPPTPQDNPLMNLTDENLIPVLGLDVWEVGRGACTDV